MPDLKGICCVCIQKCPDFKNISESDEKNVQYIEKLLSCLPNLVWKEDYSICTDCLEKLNNAYDFIQVCVENEKFRNDLAIENVEQTIERDSLKCYECDRSFKLQRTLKVHITRMHKNGGKSKKSKKEDSEVKEEFFEEPNLEAIDLEVEIDKENIEKRRGQEKIDYDENSSSNDDIFNEKRETSDGEFSDDQDEKKEIPRKRAPKNKVPLTCTYCGVIMFKKILFYAHIRSEHTFEKPFSCDECDARYMNAYSLLIHKRKHNNEKPFICAMCGKSFISSADLNHHNKTHTTERAYPCSLCERSFKTHSNLRTHKLQMHLDPSEWKFSCNVCEKKFPIRGNLVKHMKRHIGIKDFACHICEKKFINKAELNLHINTHSNNRLFKCKICTCEYKNREGLRRHMKVNHDLGNWKAPKLEKKYLCPMCPKIFAFSNKLQRHICTHTGEKPFLCDFCPKRFVDNYSRKVHLKKEHNVDVY